MRLRNVWVIAKREYLARVQTKGFWLSTLVLPIFMASVIVLPSLFLTKTRSALEVVLVDATGELADEIVADFAGDGERANERLSLVELAAEEAEPDPAAKRAELNERVLEGDVDAWIWIDEAGLAENEVEYHAESVSNLITQEDIEDVITRVVRRHRLESAGYDPEEVGRLARHVSISPIRVTEEGDEEGGALAGMVLAFSLFFLLYMVLVIYGQQVLNGVLEEKTSRIVEVVVSTVRPVELMMGKLVGICGVALSQLAIWLGTASVLTFPSVVSAMAWMPEEVTVPTLPLGLVGHFFLLFLLGFFLFASIYAAIGAAFNNLQEAQQVAGVAVFFIVAPMFFVWSVQNDPDSTAAVVASLIPFFTPLLMLLRIAVKTPPLWQILLAYALTGLFVFLMIRLAARIYRTGILMYGKKPTFKEIWRWLRYA